jgi:hypothetical protein
MSFWPEGVPAKEKIEPPKIDKSPTTELAEKVAVRYYEMFLVIDRDGDGSLTELEIVQSIEENKWPMDESKPIKD